MDGDVPDEEADIETAPIAFVDVEIIDDGIVRLPLVIGRFWHRFFGYEVLGECSSSVADGVVFFEGKYGYIPRSLQSAEVQKILPQPSATYEGWDVQSLKWVIQEMEREVYV